MKEIIKLGFQLIDAILELIFGIIILIGFIWYMFTDTYIWTEKVPFLIIICLILLSTKHKRRE